MLNIKLTRKRRMQSHKSVKQWKGGQHPLKVAILFVGRIKGYDEPNIKEYLRRIKEKYNPVVFCSLNKTNKTDYIKEFCKLMDITDDRLYLEKTPPYPKYMNHVAMADTLKGKWGNAYGKNSAYSNFYHMQKAWKLFEKHNAEFDIVLYFRADIVTKDNLTLLFPIKDNTLYIPQNNPHCDFDGGLCMSFLYGKPNTMKYFFNIIDSIEDMCNEGVIYHAETLFKAHLQRKKIDVERFPYTFTHTNARHQPHLEANKE